MPTDDDRPLVVPSAVDPDVECVRIDSQTPTGGIAQSPEPSEPDGSSGPPLCPEGYVPRRRRQPRTLDGKRVVTDSAPTRNPDDPPPA